MLRIVKRVAGVWRRLSRWGFPFMVLRSSRTPMGRIRAAARSAMFVNQTPLQRSLLKLGMTLCWPFGAWLETRRCLDNALIADRVPGIRPGFRLGLQMWRMAMLHNVPPIEFVSYRLARPGQRHLAGDYFYWSETELLRLLNARCGADLRDVQDKARFAALCGVHGLPCIPTLAVFRQGAQALDAQTRGRSPLSVETPRLWVKDLAGKKGSGQQQWTRVNEGYRNAQGRLLPPDALWQHLAQRDCIVQPWLDNHPQLAAWSDGALVSLRIVTGRHPGGEVERVAALLHLRHGRQHSLVCGIDTVTGRITHALDANGHGVEVFPVNGSPLVGVCIPFWRQALERALQAHAQAFEHFVFLGWDVAVTAEGPVLIEANAGWGALHHQMIDDKPLGESAFSVIALAHLETPECA